MPAESLPDNPVPSTKSENPCPDCLRSERYCVCAHIIPVDTRTEILVLQHPQEPGVAIGTAPIIQKGFTNARIVTGLSWANLKKILKQEVTYQQWGVLYVGSIRTEQLPSEGLYSVSDKGVIRPNQKQLLSSLKGIIVLDGTWSQAKTLWWRNPWLLKVQRLVVRSDQKSLYDTIRKEPRRGCFSSIEALAEALEHLESKKGEIRQSIQTPLGELVGRLERGHKRSRSRSYRRGRHG
jgi:DTW domain-containing protein